MVQQVFLAYILLKLEKCIFVRSFVTTENVLISTHAPISTHHDCLKKRHMHISAHKT